MVMDSRGIVIIMCSWFLTGIDVIFIEIIQQEEKAMRYKSNISISK